MSEETDPHTPARPTIFLVEEDDDVRPILTRSLRKRGYRLPVAASLEDAREWVEDERLIHADPVLINLVGRTLEEALTLGRELCDHARYDGRTPLVTVPENVPEELAGQNVDVSGHDWVCYDDGGSDQLGRLLARLLHGASIQERPLAPAHRSASAPLSVPPAVQDPEGSHKIDAHLLHHLSPVPRRATI